MTEKPNPHLIWITPRYAVNLANVSTVFHGTHGEIQITFVGGPPLNCSEKDLLPAASAILVPHTETIAPHLQLEQSSVGENGVSV